MKKVFATILAVIYLSTSMGATVHFHYCMGRLMDWGLLDHGRTDCSFCGMRSKPAAEGAMGFHEGLLPDEHRLIKSKEDQKGVQLSFELAKAPVTVADVPFASWIAPFCVVSYSGPTYGPCAAPPG